MPALMLSKAGVGSRGGHQIGSTKSGKPIYESSHARYAAMHVHEQGDIGKDAGRLGGSFAHYSKSDHAEAASTHFKQAYKADHGRKSASPEGGRHLRAALAHNRLANTTSVKKSYGSLVLAHEQLSKGMKSGEGSRGGHIIGHTKSGAPIYGPNHDTYTTRSSKHPAAVAVGDDSGDRNKRDKLLHKMTPSFTQQDHEDARDVHRQAANWHANEEAETFKRATGSKHGPASGNMRGSDTAKLPHNVIDTMEHHRQSRIKHETIAGVHHSVSRRMAFGDTHYPDPSKTVKSLTSDTAMTSTDLFKSFLAKGQFQSGNIENAETVDGLDGDMTGSSSNGKSSSAPAGDDDREEENKKVKKKVGKNSTNGGPAKSVESIVGVSESDAGKEDKLQDCGPYDIGGDVTDDIGVPPAGKLVDGYILRAEQVGEMMKAGEGSRGGKILGHTKSGKPIYSHKYPKDKNYEHFTAQDHKDAFHAHESEQTKLEDKASNIVTDNADSKAAGKAAGKHEDIASYHKFKANELGNEERQARKSEMAAGYYQGGDAKSYQQRIEQRGFVQHATGGMDDYLAHISKSNGFYANGSDHHSPNDANRVAQTLCKSCDQEHSAMYGVCPHCGPSTAFGKSHSASQDHRGFGMLGREQGSTLVDMSAFSLED
jgi:hypothetical protein